MEKSFHYASCGNKLVISPLTTFRQNQNLTSGVGDGAQILYKVYLRTAAIFKPVEKSWLFTEIFISWSIIRVYHTLWGTILGSALKLLMDEWLSYSVWLFDDKIVLNSHLIW